MQLGHARGCRNAIIHSINGKISSNKSVDKTVRYMGWCIQSTWPEEAIMIVQHTPFVVQTTILEESLFIVRVMQCYSEQKMRLSIGYIYILLAYRLLQPITTYMTLCLLSRLG